MLNDETSGIQRKCKGVVVVQYCPYTMDSSSIDFGALKNNTKFLVDFAKGGNKDVVIMTNGSTTENYANSIEEQKSVIKTVVETVDGAVPVVAGVSQPGTKKTIELAKICARSWCRLCHGFIAVLSHSV